MERDALLSKAQKGDGDAFAQLCAPHAGMIYRHCLQMLGSPEDAEDAAQEALVRAFRAVSRFLGHSAFSTWLFRIAHNTCLDVLKRPARRAKVASLEALKDAGFDPPAEDSASSPEESYLRSAQMERLRQAIALLPVDQQQLLTLHYGEGLPYQALAARLQMREGTVKSKLNRARTRLKELLP